MCIRDRRSYAKKLSSGLLQLGIKPGDKVGIVVYKNRPEWLIADLAIQYIGAIGIPMYPTISIREYEYIMNESEVKVCFVGMDCLLYTSPSPRDRTRSRMPSSA